jgi:predicted phosphodiesterase
MRIALISDIHSNVHALRAVLDDITARGLLNRTYHLGDLVGYAPYPNDDAEQERLSHESYAWTLRHTEDAALDYLGALPFRLDLRPGGGHLPGRKIVLVHGTPTLNTLYWHADRPDDFCSKMAATAGARPGDLIAFGHTHIPWFRDVEGIHYLNTGSVGRPKDGDWRAGYAIVDLIGDTPEVEFLRVEYDVDSACDGIRRSGLPDFFAAYLATGGSATPARA